MRILAALSALVCLSLGYVAGTNAQVVTHAIYVSHVTGVPLMQVLAPVSRQFVRNAIEASTVPAVDADDGEAEQG